MIRQFDIALVGGGVSGLASALAIAAEFDRVKQRPPSMVLIDAAESPLATEPMPADAISVDSFDPRVVALTETNCAILAEWGVWSEIAASGAGDYRRMFVWDGEGTASIDFDCTEVGLERLGAVVENRVLVSALFNRLQDLGVCHCRYGMSVTGIEQDAEGGATIQFDDGSTLQASLLVGADGARSVVKSLCGFESREWDYGQDAIVCTVETELSHQHTAWQCFTRHGPLAFLPVSRSEEPGEHYCSIVWSLERERATELMGLEAADFASAMQESFESRLGELKAVSQRFSFPLWQRHSKQYVRGSAVLVGDAAHTLHPLAGQGINIGLKDARSLAAALAKSAVKGRALSNLPMLRRFERERLTENLAMMAAVEFFKRLYSPGSSVLQLLRNRGMAVVDAQAALKRQIIKLAVGQ